MNKQSLLSIIVLCLSTLLLTSCNPKFYAPNTINAPLFTTKGSFAANASTDGNRADVQLGYAITKHVAVIANGAAYFPSDDDNGNGGKGSLFEAGVGGFTPIGDNFVFDTYGIVGFGSMDNHFPGSINSYPGTDGQIHANMLRLALQPSFGYKQKYWEVAVSARVGNMSYGNISGNLTTDNVNQQLYLKEHRSQFMVEPAVTLRGGLPYLKLQLQLGGCINVTNSDFPQDKSWLAVGLFYRFKH